LPEIYALALGLKKSHCIKAEWFRPCYQRNQMISDNAWNALMRIEGSIYNSIYSLLGGIYILYTLPPFLVSAFLSTA